MSNQKISFANFNVITKRLQLHIKHSHWSELLECVKRNLIDVFGEVR